jgi:formylglycine-generating enzyme required for sulfatase activity
MRKMKTICCVAAFLGFTSAARADVFHMGPGLTSLEFVTVGNPGNAADTRYDSNGFGSVPYKYRMGTYDVTSGQYTEFLNAVAKADPFYLYDNGPMSEDPNACIARSGAPGSYSYAVIDSPNKPVVWVGSLEAARFANWLQNGQPAGAEGPGTTETGAYTLNGISLDDMANPIMRNSGAKYFIPSEDEWYKAAYYDPAASQYWDYATGTNIAPVAAKPGNTPNSANFSDVTYDGSKPITQNDLTDVGTYTASPSRYGTYDQNGDVFQWNETFFSDPLNILRCARGGSVGVPSSSLHASFRLHEAENDSASILGFRIAAAVPEPSALVLGILAGVGLSALLVRRRRLTTL